MAIRQQRMDCIGQSCRCSVFVALEMMLGRTAKLAMWPACGSRADRRLLSRLCLRMPPMPSRPILVRVALAVVLMAVRTIRRYSPPHGRAPRHNLPHEAEGRRQAGRASAGQPPSRLPLPSRLLTYRRRQHHGDVGLVPKACRRRILHCTSAGH